MYDLVIIGGGPGGVAAGIYASRKKMKTVLVTDSFGGQSLVSSEVKNWIGVKSISGFDLAKNLEEHLKSQPGIEILEGDLVQKIEKLGSGFKVSTANGKILETKAMLICSGRRHRKLEAVGAKEFDGRGIVYCATCDAPLFEGKPVAVVGAGNAAMDTVRDLLAYATKIYVLVRSEKIKGDQLTFEEIKKDSRVEIIFQAEVKEILGKEFLTGLKYLDKASNQIKDLTVEGVFVEIGSIPNVEFLGDLTEKNTYNEIVVDSATQKTSQPGIWAVGDVTILPYRQNNISAGDAIKAVLNIQDYLNKNSK